MENVHGRLSVCVLSSYVKILCHLIYSLQLLIAVDNCYAPICIKCENRLFYIWKHLNIRLFFPTHVLQVCFVCNLLYVDVIY